MTELGMLYMIWLLSAFLSTNNSIVNLRLGPALHDIKSK